MPVGLNVVASIATPHYVSVAVFNQLSEAKHLHLASRTGVGPESTASSTFFKFLWRTVQLHIYFCSFSSGVVSLSMCDNFCCTSSLTSFLLPNISLFGYIFVLHMPLCVCGGVSLHLGFVSLLSVYTSCERVCICICAWVLQVRYVIRG